MKPCEPMPSWNVPMSLPDFCHASRYRSVKGLKRAGSPPMMARVMGRPRVAARTTLSGVPPTAIQTGTGSCTGRGYTPRPWMVGVWVPFQFSTSPLRISNSMASFSLKSSS